MSEAGYQKRITDYATTHGWHWVHFPRSRLLDRKGARYSATAYHGDGEGWPDLFCWRPGEHLWIEVKAKGGIVSRAQRATHAELIAAGCEVHLARPADWPAIRSRLSAPPCVGSLPENRRAPGQ